MAYQWLKTSYPGVRYREHKSRKHNNKPDRYFTIHYKLEGKQKEEGLGWASEGWTAEKANITRAELRKAQTTGEGAASLEEKRLLAEQARREAAERRAIEAKQLITFGQLWQKYSEWMSKASAEGDRLRYRKHLKRRFANKPLSEISPFDLERMKSELLKKGLAPATVKHCLVQVRQVINKGIAWGLWNGENPVRKVKLPRLNNKRERFLTVEEAGRLLAALTEISPLQHDIALLSLHTGMRAGEMFALKWSHLDFRQNMIHIADPKGGKARKAFMTSTVRAMLQERLPDRKGPEHPVFHTRGNPIKKLSRTFERVVDRLGFNKGITDRRQRVCFHSCRHTFASWLAIQGTPILTIKELLGHSSLEMTERYAHLMPDQKREAVNQLEQYLINHGENNGTGGKITDELLSIR